LLKIESEIESDGKLLYLDKAIIHPGRLQFVPKQIIVKNKNKKKKKYKYI